MLFAELARVKMSGSKFCEILISHSNLEQSKLMAAFGLTNHCFFALIYYITQLEASLVSQKCFISANFSLFVFFLVYNSNSLEEKRARM